MIKAGCWYLLLLVNINGLPLDGDRDTSMFFNKIDPVLIEGSVAGPVPYMVALTTGAVTRSFLCGASLITNRHFLTGASCIDFVKDSNDSLRGTVGSNAWQSGGTHYSIARAIIHGGFNRSSFKNDISILVTASVVKLNDEVQPVVLNFDFIPGNVAAVVNGWGLTNLTVIVESPILMELQPNIVDGNQCAADIADLAKKRNMTIHPVDPKLEICAYHNATSGFCYGDGGSPLVLQENHQQIGIVSWTIDCAIGIPDVYTRISAFKSWILNYTSL